MIWGFFHVSYLDGCSVGVVAPDTNEPMLKTMVDQNDSCWDRTRHEP